MFPHGTVQYSTVQYSTVQYSTVQYSTVQYSTVQYSTVQYSAVQYSTVQYSTVQYNTVQYSTVQYSTVHTVQYVRHSSAQPLSYICVSSLMRSEVKPIVTSNANICWLNALASLYETRWNNLRYIKCKSQRQNVTSNQHQLSAATESVICVPIDEAVSVLEDRALTL